jgi:AraC-like DNA-binding protein
MPASTIAICSDPRAFEAAVQRGCSIELFVTGKGQFRAEVIGIVLPRLRLLRGKEQLSRIAAVSVSPRSLLVILPIDTEQPQTCGGVRLGSREIMTATAGERLHLWTSGPCVWGIISVSAKEFASYGRAVVGRNFTLAPGVRRLQPSLQSLRSLIALFRAALRLTEAQPGTPVRSDGATESLEQEVIQALLGCMSTATVQANPAAHPQRATMVRLNELLQQGGRIPHASDVCVALGITSRTLQACCRQQVGVSPTRYFRLLAMRRVCDALMRSQPGTASVSQIAKCHGFTGTGRFAAAYQRQFGEFPSATLRRDAT